MDWNYVAVAVQAIALLGVVWKGSGIVTGNKKDWEHQEEMNKRFEEEDRLQREARLQTAVINERIVMRLDFIEERHDKYELRLAVVEGHMRAAK
jgi:hypothetical protein